MKKKDFVERLSIEAGVKSDGVMDSESVEK